MKTKELAMETLERIAAYTMPIMTRIKMLGVIDPALGKEMEKIGKDFDPTEIARIIEKAISSAVARSEYERKKAQDELSTLYEDRTRLEITLGEVLEQMSRLEERLEL